MYGKQYRKQQCKLLYEQRRREGTKLGKIFQDKKCYGTTPLHAAMERVPIIRLKSYIAL
jgi:hypothetical protein